MCFDKSVRKYWLLKPQFSHGIDLVCLTTGLDINLEETFGRRGKWFLFQDPIIKRAPNQFKD